MGLGRGIDCVKTEEIFPYQVVLEISTYPTFFLYVQGAVCSIRGGARFDVCCLAFCFQHENLALLIVRHSHCSSCNGIEVFEYS